ncbi:MAG TPA: GNAT family N-acetyltransferase [Gaiellales bacterium]|nr:GNAT family N-acetyltransferase [Gaiellales bacterium]
MGPRHRRGGRPGDLDGQPADAHVRGGRRRRSRARLGRHGPEPRRPGVARGNSELHGHPAAGGRGAGRVLGERVLDQARADGYRAMQFNAVVESNARAVALWQSLGFHVLATVPEAFDHPTDGLVGLHIMHRPL